MKSMLLSLLILVADAAQATDTTVVLKMDPLWQGPVYVSHDIKGVSKGMASSGDALKINGDSGQMFFAIAPNWPVNSAVCRIYVNAKKHNDYYAIPPGTHTTRCAIAYGTCSLQMVNSNFELTIDSSIKSSNHSRTGTDQKQCGLLDLFNRTQASRVSLGLPP